MSSVIEDPSAVAVENGDLRDMEGRLDRLDDLMGPAAVCGADSSFPEAFSLANYRREVAKTIDEVLAETEIWWVPERS
jgi:hypothetical protein